MADAIVAPKVEVKEAPKVVTSEVKEVAINKVEPLPVSTEVLSVDKVLKGIQSGDPADINKSHHGG